MLRHVLGIDQGGSKTLALIVDELGCVKGLGVGGGACCAVCGLPAAMDAVACAVEQACAAAALTLSQIDRVAAGMTGIDWPEDNEALRTALAERLSYPAEQIDAINDSLIALRAGTNRQGGCILCAGSGLNCAVRRDTGEAFVFGYLIRDDCQGGSALAQRAIRAVLDMEAGILKKTHLYQALPPFLGYRDAFDMLRAKASGALPADRLLQVSKLLEAEALDGDDCATDIWRSFARDAAQYAAAGLNRLGLNAEPVDVVLSGGVFKCRVQTLIATLSQEILRAAPYARIIESRYEPVVGAALTALDAMGINLPVDAGSRLHRSAAVYRLLRK